MFYIFYVCIYKLAFKFCSYDPINYNLTVDIKFPKNIIFIGNYEVNGKFMVLQIAGNGDFNIEIGNEI